MVLILWYILLMKKSVSHFLCPFHIFITFLELWFLAFECSWSTFLWLRLFFLNFIAMIFLLSGKWLHNFWRVVAQLDFCLFGQVNIFRESPFCEVSSTLTCWCTHRLQHSLSVKLINIMNFSEHMIKLSCNYNWRYKVFTSFQLLVFHLYKVSWRESAAGKRQDKT